MRESINIIRNNINHKQRKITQLKSMFLKKINMIDLCQITIIEKREKSQMVKIQNEKGGKSIDTRFFK